MPKTSKTDFQYFGSLDEVRRSITHFTDVIAGLSSVKTATNNYINRNVLRFRAEAAAPKFVARTLRGDTYRRQSGTGPAKPKLNPVLTNHFKSIQDLQDLRTEAD